jgi:glycine dehydrogenase
LTLFILVDDFKIHFQVNYSRPLRISRNITHGKDVFKTTDQFLHRHVGSQGAKKQSMLDEVGFKNLDDLIDLTVPKSIRLQQTLRLDPPLSESEALASLKRIMSKNKVLKSFIGVGYYETLTPAVILRNVREN